MSRQFNGLQSDMVADFVNRTRAILDGEQEPHVLHEPEFSSLETQLVLDCIETGWVSSVGKYVDHFEQDLAQANEVEFCVATVNGTAALQIALTVAGIKPNDEVLVPSLTFVGTANAIMHCQAIPHFVDVDRSTLGLCGKALNEHLEHIIEWRNGSVFNKNTGRRIGGIVPMHTFGHAVDMGPVIAVGQKFNIPIVEDAAEALGSKFRDRPCGSIGKVGALSFNGNKILTTGGGGAILTNDADIASRARHLCTTAKQSHPFKYVHDEVAFNYRLPNINAALGVGQMKQLEQRVKLKRALASRYSAAFEGATYLTFFSEPEHSCSNCWLNCIVLGDELAAYRDDVLDALHDAMILARPTWNLLHTLPMFESAPRAGLSVSEYLEKRLICLPSSAKFGR